MNEIKCPWCEYKHHNIENSLRIHCHKLHKKTSQELCDALYFEFGATRPTCKCGCGNTPAYKGLEVKYLEWLRGHISRVKNNWGHNPEVIKKSRDTQREMRKNGEYEPVWNKGLDISDPRVAQYGKKGSETIRNKPGELERRSERMKIGRLDGTVPTLYGEDHSQWKGGLSSINALARSNLNSVWTFPKLAKANYTCELCGINKDLCVHHNGEKFSEISNKITGQYTVAEITENNSKIVDEIVDYHIRNDTKGIVLCIECHAKEHEKLGETGIAYNIRNRIFTRKKDPLDSE